MSNHAPSDSTRSYGISRASSTNAYSRHAACEPRNTGTGCGAPRSSRGGSVVLMRTPSCHRATTASPSSRARLIAEHTVDPQYFRHVGHGLREWRYLSAVPLHGVLAGIVCRESQPNILAEPVHQELQVARAGVYVLFRIIRIRNAEARGGCRHELHQTDRASFRYGARVEARLH